MKVRLLFVLLGICWLLSACAAQPAVSKSAEKPRALATNEPTATTSEMEKSASDGILHTPMGDFLYVSSRFVQEVHDVKPEPGHKILLVSLKRVDQQPVDLQQFHDAHMQIFIQSEDGSSSLSTMGGFVEEEFVIGFQVPDTIKTYILIWDGNLPMEIVPEIK